MIFYFSGTGNSLWVAKTLAISFGEQLVRIADFCIPGEFTNPVFSLEQHERIGFVFPVHSWGIPPIVKLFIQRLTIQNYKSQLVYGIFTCGDECGYTKQTFLNLLAEKRWKSHHVYSIQMPNNYIIFPGFEVDEKGLEEKKKQEAKLLLPQLIQSIVDDCPMNGYLTGSMPYLKSKIIHPLFCKYALNSKPFYSTKQCKGCGVCVKKCPTKNITIENGRPKWGKNCTQCLACIHYCPEKAIEYGKVTRKKKRYTYSEK